MEFVCEGQPGSEGEVVVCQACHEAPAVVRVVCVVDGEEVEVWLCSECARTDFA